MNAALATCLLLLASCLPFAAVEHERPNIVLIVADDHGFRDYGFMGNAAVRTPNLDRMAADSLLYTRGYVMPVCAPSLASLLTGKLPSGHGITGNDLAKGRAAPSPRAPLTARMLANSLLLPKALSDAGYLTFQTGKLWNGTYRDFGFTHGMTDTAGRHGDAGLDIGRKGMQPIYDFLATAKAANKPFFVWHAPFLPHTPHNAPARLLDKYRGKGPTPAAERYHAMVEWLDETTGELDAHLAQHGLRDDTVIVYLADNGWDAAHGHQSDRAKLSPYELGIRTPMFVRWPAKLKPARDDETLAHIVDVAPTILGLAGVARPEGLPGIDLTDRAAMQARTTVFVEAYTHDIADLADPAKSRIADVVIDGWWKAILPGAAKPDRAFAGVPATPVLYDLATDPLEQRDLAAAKPEQLARLRALLASARKE